MKNLLLILLFVFLTSILFFSIQEIKAQDLPFEATQAKKFQKMDSTLAQLYDRYLKGEDLVEYLTAHGIYKEGERVRIVIELASEASEIPTGLDIMVETSYKNLVQAMVPIRNFQKISLDENVKFLSLPIEEVPDEAEISTLAEESSISISPLFLFLIVPAVIIPLFYFRRKSRG